MSIMPVCPGEILKGHESGQPEGKGLSGTRWCNLDDTLSFVESESDLNLPPERNFSEFVLHQAPNPCDIPFRRPHGPGAVIWSII